LVFAGVFNDHPTFACAGPVPRPAHTLTVRIGRLFFCPFLQVTKFLQLGPYNTQFFLQRPALTFAGLLLPAGRLGNSIFLRLLFTFRPYHSPTNFPHSFGSLFTQIFTFHTDCLYAGGCFFVFDQFRQITPPKGKQGTNICQNSFRARIPPSPDLRQKVRLPCPFLDRSQVFFPK